MLPVVDALQFVVTVQVIQTIALVLAVVFVLRKLKSGVLENRKREQQRDEIFSAELKRFELQVRAARAESAQYLESIFTGVQGMARNLDATRAALEDLPKPRTGEEPRPAELIKLRETLGRR